MSEKLYSLPEANGNVAGVHAVLCVVFLDFVEMLYELDSARSAVFSQHTRISALRVA